MRANVEYDSARLVKFSPDNRSFIASLDNSNAIRVFKITKNDDGSLGKVQQVLDFDKVSDGQWGVVTPCHYYKSTRRYLYPCGFL